MTFYTYGFYKNSENEWYMRLPEWKGDPDDLQMINGADEWLELVGNGAPEVTLNFSDEPFQDAETLTLLHRPEENLGGGGVYYLDFYNLKKCNLKLWLCDVTCFIFGDFPQKIYFSLND